LASKRPEAPVTFLNVPVLVMGVLNVTPDSFSDGGRWLDADAAVARGLEMFAAGAAVVDVGGESTRPGAADVDVDEELRRVIPVVEALAGRGRVSIDTRKGAVAEAALAAGATLLNDISASLAPVAAAAGAGYVAMHMQGTPATMQVAPNYEDVVSEVAAFLSTRAREATDAGVEEVFVDPGIGFGKTTAHNLELLRRLRMIVDLGYPVVIGTSRKRFLGDLVGGADVDDRLEGSVATAVQAALAGVAMVRVHDVAETVQVLRVTEAARAGVAA
jgi:dihydropteroate synthase